MLVFSAHAVIVSALSSLNFADKFLWVPVFQINGKLTYEQRWNISETTCNMPENKPVRNLLLEGSPCLIFAVQKYGLFYFQRDPEDGVCIEPAAWGGRSCGAASSHLVH
jgi:hypothetical protein